MRATLMPFTTLNIILYLVAVLLVVATADTSKRIHSVNYGQVISVNMTFDATDLGPIQPNGFFDLEPACLTCPNGLFLEESTVCAQNSSSEFTKTFMDPLVISPEDPIRNYIVDSVNVTVYGRFNCDNASNGATLIVRLDENVIQVLQTEPAPVGCGTCPTCSVAISMYGSAAWLGINGWPGWRSGSNNTLKAQILDGRACLSSVQLTLSYLPAPPVINSITPSYGPTSGFTQLTVRGQGFRPPDQQNIQCLFDNQPPQFALFEDSQTVWCYTPASNASGPIPLNLKAFQDNRIYALTTALVTFNYYDDPIVTAVIPDAGVPAGNFPIEIWGENFVETNALAVQFGSSLARDCQLINSSLINCTAPSGFGVVNISISLNDEDFTNTNIQFSYRYTPPPSPINWSVIIVALSAFAAFAVATCVAMALYTTFSRMHFPQAADESSRLLADPTDGSNDLNSIQLGQLIGRGTHGEVYVGHWNGTQVAVKKFNASWSPEFEAELQHEATIMRQLRHPNVLQFLVACTTPPDMPRGSLYSVIHNTAIVFDCDLVKRIMLDAARGMNYLHHCNPIILHRDLKSHNLLLDENWKCKVCDFGLSKILDTSDVNTLTACGTPCWAAPEVLRGQRYTEKADVYSYGVVLWECFARETPYKHLLPFQVVHAVGTQGKRPDIPVDTPAAAVRLIKLCWAENPDARPSFDDIMVMVEQLNDANWRGYKKKDEADEGDV